MPKLLRNLFVLILIGCGPAWGQASTPAGLWQTVSDRTGQPRGLVRVEEVNGEYIGTVVAVLSPPAPDAQPFCKPCPGGLKDKPGVGMIILPRVRPARGTYSTRQVLDPHQGGGYKCRIKLLDEGTKPQSPRL